MTDNIAVPTEVTMREITALVREFTDSGWASLELDIHGMHLVLGRDEAPPTAHAAPSAGAAVASPPAAAAIQEPPAAPAPVLASTPAPVAAPAAASTPARTNNSVEVRSPVVGAFWAAPSPGEDPFVTVGQHVDEGQQLGIVEVMKLMNNVSSPVSGAVVAIEAQNADMVEYDQVLFMIEADDA